jgi:hypothetical protein
MGDIVTWGGNAVALQRNCSCRKSAGAVEAGNHIADEQAGRFNNDTYPLHRHSSVGK